MDPSTIPPSSISPRPGGPRPAALMVIALACAVPLVLALSLHVVRPSAGPPDTAQQRVEVLGRGLEDLDVPLMALYTAPPMPGATVDSTATWNYSSALSGPSTTYRFQWNSTTVGGRPVRFLFNNSLLDGDSGSFHGTADGLLFYPAGPCRAGCIRTGQGVGIGPAGVRQVVYERWQLTYVVFNVTEVSPAGTTSFLEVHFAFARLLVVSEPMPAANTTYPGPSDLARLGIHRLDAGSELSMSVRDQTLVPNLFRNRVTTIAFDAGPLGSLSAHLDSEYSWSLADDHSLSFSASTEATIQYSIDLRFGSLLIEYVPWPYP